MERHLPEFHKRMIPPRFIFTVINRLKAAGFEAYIVGGAVRDAYLHRNISDWDVATSAPFEDIDSLFSDTRRYKLNNETVTLVDSGCDYEVTTYRSRDNTPPSLEGDLMCRDFTINAMSYDITENKLYDPYGGIRDMNNRIVRAVGRPDERFTEDPLRLLRAIRIACELGFRIEKDTANKIGEMSETLNAVACERIRDELMKILASPKPSRGFYLMKKTGLLKHFLPELNEGYLKRQNSYHRHTIFRHIMICVDSVSPDPVLRLAALFHDIAKPFVRKKIEGEFRFHDHEKASAIMAGDIMRRLKFSGESTKKVSHLISLHMIDYERSWKDSAIRRFIRRVGIENMDDLMDLRRADLIAHAILDDRMENINELERRVRELRGESLVKGLKGLAIDGNKVMRILNISEGPAVGRALGKLMGMVMEYPDLNNEKDLTAIVKTMTMGDEK